MKMENKTIVGVYEDNCHFPSGKIILVNNMLYFGSPSGSCPGGGLSNMITLLVQADLIQSVVMTFVSTILAVGMLPFNLWVYARAFAPANGGDSDQRMGLPLGKILSQIIMLTIPLMLGIIIRHKLPKVSMVTQFEVFVSAVSECLSPNFHPL